MASFAILIARFTPKQKPALSATITSTLVRSSWKIPDGVHHPSRERVGLGAAFDLPHRGHDHGAEGQPDFDLSRHGSADLSRSRDAGGENPSAGRSCEARDSGARRQKGPGFAAGALRKDQYGSTFIQHPLGAAKR